MDRLRIWLARQGWLELMVEGHGIKMAGSHWTIIALSPAGLLWSFTGEGDEKITGWDCDTHLNVSGELGVYNP